MILHKVTRFEEHTYSYDSIEEFEEHKIIMENAGFISNPYLHLRDKEVVQYCNYRRQNNE